MMDLWKTRGKRRNSPAHRRTGELSESNKPPSMLPNKPSEGGKRKRVSFVQPKDSRGNKRLQQESASIDRRVRTGSNWGERFLGGTTKMARLQTHVGRKKNTRKHSMSPLCDKKKAPTSPRDTILLRRGLRTDCWGWWLFPKEEDIREFQHRKAINDPSQSSSDETIHA
ncbi:unnamed protein product [Protopolystoma xenopodis]|uniref:Uncharacterized protein n=1 Tax=Protopolystoma xenopodis TaxID=117903 RepID=A0A448XBD0_9PLAT|nr:unnamed protein product [Protopolystoma xenopodis]